MSRHVLVALVLVSVVAGVAPAAAEDLSSVPRPLSPAGIEAAIAAARTAPEVLHLAAREGGVAAFDPPPTLAATDSLYEDRVELRWTPLDEIGIIYRIYRRPAGSPATADSLIGIASSDDALFVDDTGDAGATYTYCLRVLDLLDDTEGAAVCDDGTRVLFRPSGVDAGDDRHETHVEITWTDRSAIEAGYRIERDGSPLVVLPADHEVYEDSTAVPGVVYAYCVIPFDSAAREADPVCDDGRRGFILPPLFLDASDGQFTDAVHLSWTVPTDREAEIRLYRHAPGASPGAPLAVLPPDTESYLDSTAVAGTVYEYCVSTADSSANESALTCDEGGIDVLPAPRNVTATDLAYDDKVVITWADPSDTEDGFHVYRRKLTEPDSTLLVTLDANETEHEDTGAEPGVTYLYCVTAFSDQGGVSASACDEGTRAEVLAPEAVAATDGDFEDRVELTWESRATRAVLFKVYRNGTAIASVAGHRRSFTDPDIPSGGTVSYAVAALTSLGVASDTTSDTGYRELIGPDSVDASDGASESRTTVSWQDGSSIETGYRIYRRPAGTADPLTEVGTRPTNRTSFQDRTGAPGVVYDYVVAAFHVYGDSMSTESATDTDSGFRDLLPPSLVEASDGTFEDRVEVIWTDASQAEDGYRIHRKESGSAADSVLIGTVAANMFSFVDDGSTVPLVLGAVYDYFVNPFDSSGSGPPASDPGSTAILPPQSVNASEIYRDHVVVVWTDVSQVETGYRILRDGAELATIGPNVTSYDDTAAVGLRTYCVETVSGPVSSGPVCAEGRISVPDPADAAVANLMDLGAGETGALGIDIDISGDWAIVGAPNSNAGGSGRGSALLLHLEGGEWVLKQRLDGLVNDLGFGAKVAIDGDWAAVLERGSLSSTLPSVFTYERIGESWQYRQTLPLGATIPGGGLALGLDLSGVHLLASVGWGSGVINIWRRSGTSFSLDFQLPLGGGSFLLIGQAVAVEGGLAVIPSTSQAGVQVLRRGSGTAPVGASPANWGLVATLTPPDGAPGFGTAVDIDGENILVGQGRGGEECSAYLFEPTGIDSWSAVDTDPGTPGFDKFSAGDGLLGNYFGSSLDLEGDVALIGAYQGYSYANRAGTAHLFRRVGAGWDRVLDVTRPDPGPGYFGFGLALGDELRLGGQSVLLGAWDRDNLDGTRGALYSLPFLRNLAASDGTHSNRVRVSWDAPTEATGFDIYRDGELIGTLGDGERSYDDFDAPPGRTAEYCVTALRPDGRSFSSCDYGRRAPNGAIAGRVTTLAGSAVDSVVVALEPAITRSIQFDGDGGHLLIPRAVIPEGDLSVEFWVRTRDTGASALLSYATPLEDDQLLIANPSDLTVTVNGMAGALSGVAVNDGTWHHVALTWTQSTGEALLYVDEVLEQTQVVAPGASRPSGGVLVLGQDQDAEGGGFESAQAFNGEIDDLRLWAGARSQASILAGKNRLLTGTEPDLLGYWPLDQVDDPAADDLTGNLRYGVLRGGAHWSDAGSDAIRVTAVTDLEGNYTLAGLRYGIGTEFTVIPSRGTHKFSPGFKRITLSTGNPVQNEVFFTDVTAYAVTGVVRYEGTDCFTEGVQILVDGRIVGTTDDQGRFAVSVSPGTRVLRFNENGPGDILQGHTFSPATLTLNDVGKDIVLAEPILDTTRRRFTGRAEGGCGIPVGTLSISVESEDGCFSRTFDASGFFRESLPPLRYFTRVESVVADPGGPDALDVELFFDDLGVRELDLTEGDAELDFRYRAPITVEVTGLPEPDPGCALGVPVIEQLDRFPLTISVFEDYGDLGRCPVDTGTVTLFDEIIDQENDPVTLTIAEGVALLPDGNRYVTAANTPNIFAGRVDENGTDRSYQKSLTVVAEATGAPAVRKTVWAIVTGHRPRVATFTSVSEGIPLLILRDPPGDGSFSFVEQETTFCSTYSSTLQQTLSQGFSGKLHAGVKFIAGFGIMTEIEAKVFVSGGLEVGISSTQDEEFTVCATTTEEFSTSSDELFIGPDGDVYIGLALNVIFAKTDVVRVNGCRVETAVETTFGVDDIETVYNYTDWHIRNTVIPQLEDLSAASPDDSVRFDSAVRNWQNHLALNDSLKAAATLERNRSFSAGADFSYTQSTTETSSFDWDVTVFTNAEAALQFKFEVAGVGAEGKFATKMKFSGTRGGGTSRTATRTVGYTLSDDDIGDFFSVDVKRDAMYGTPVFDLPAGTSSCPWEPWPNAQGAPRSQPVDGARATIEPAVRTDVPPDENAVFTLNLTNDSQAEALREYRIISLQETNPGGAVLRVDGAAIAGGQSFFIEPGETRQAVLTVGRGPNKYFYDDIQIIMTPPCEFERFRNGGPLQLTDTVSVNVSFDAPCSDITLVRPEPGWSVGVADAGNEKVFFALDDFELQVSETELLEQVGAEYRRVTSTGGPWLPIRSYSTSEIPLDASGNPERVTFEWNVGGLPDALYEVRAFTRCGGENTKVVSGTATGRIDRAVPAVLGTPEPGDQLLNLGDDISITFNEQIDCDSVKPDRISLKRATSGASVPFRTVCDGRRIVLVPTGDLGPLEGRTLRARVERITDLAGNESAPVEWTFQVRRSAFGWAKGSVLVDAAFRSPGTFQVELTNGTPSDRSFTIESLPAWLTPSPANGTVRSGEMLPVVFEIESTLGEGSFVDTVEAVVRDSVGTAVLVSPLVVRVDISCQPVAYALDPSGFEHTMTVVAELRVGGFNPQISEDPNDILLAYVGDELRGVARPESVGVNQWLAFLTVYSDRLAGETVRFRVWDNSECFLYPATDKAYLFDVDARIGSVASPTLMATRIPAPGSETLVPIREGWTWISLNRGSVVGLSTNGVLGDLNPDPGDVIKTLGSFSTFDPSLGWVGTLDTLSSSVGYAIRVSSAGTLVLDGTVALPGFNPIDVGTGWNWIAYVPQGPQAIDGALVNYGPLARNGDLVKSQFAFAEYDSVSGTWIGDLDQLEPGLGYKMHTTGPGGTFTYVASPPVRAADPLSAGMVAPASGSGRPSRFDRTRLLLPSAPVAVTAAGPGWEVNPRSYQHNMTVTASVDLGEGRSPDGVRVAAFVGDEVRGVAQVQRVDALNAHRVFLMVYSNEVGGEELRFEVYDPSRDVVQEVETGLGFSADAVVGTVRDPYALLGGEAKPGVLPAVFGLRANYPNPFRSAGAGTRISYDLPEEAEVVLRVFDLSGRLVETLVERRQPAGTYEVEYVGTGLAGGVYFYKLQAGTFTQVRKMVVLQ